MYLTILDTGYVSVSEDRGSQTQLSASNRAGYDGTSSVVSFTLKIENLSLNTNTSTDNKPVPGVFNDSPTTLISTANDVYNLSFIKQKVITTTGYGTNDMVQFRRLERTQGLKILYPSTTDDITGFKTLVEAFGASNTGDTTKFSESSASTFNGTVSLTTPYVIGRVKNFQISDNPDGQHWRGSFSFEVCG